LLCLSTGCIGSSNVTNIPGAVGGYVLHGVYELQQDTDILEFPEDPVLPMKGLHLELHERSKDNDAVVKGTVSKGSRLVFEEVRYFWYPDFNTTHVYGRLQSGPFAGSYVSLDRISKDTLGSSQSLKYDGRWTGIHPEAPLPQYLILQRSAATAP